MLRVTIEIVPFGIEERAEVLGTIKIANINTTKDNRADYKYVVWDKDIEELISGEVKKHQREKGFWCLVHKILGKIKKENKW
jgi:hypothetical protein